MDFAICPFVTLPIRDRFFKQKQKKYFGKEMYFWDLIGGALRNSTFRTQSLYHSVNICVCAEHVLNVLKIDSFWVFTSGESGP